MLQLRKRRLFHLHNLTAQTIPLLSQKGLDQTFPRAQVDQSFQELTALRLDFFSADTAVRARLAKLDPSLTGRIDALIGAMESDRNAIIAVLKVAKGDIGAETFDDVNSSLAALGVVTAVRAALARREQALDTLHICRLNPKNYSMINQRVVICSMQACAVEICDNRDGMFMEV